MRTAVLVFALSLSLCVLIYGCTVPPTVQSAAVVHEQFFNYTVHFCAMEDCMKLLTAELAGATGSIDCALYGISNDLLGSLAGQRNATVRIVVDSKAVVTEKYIESGMVYEYKGLGIMHNKYCIIDNRTVLTGSFNPTAAAGKDGRDYNNMLIINSTKLAAYYTADFHQLREGQHRQKSQAQQAKQAAVTLNETLVQAYFCPADNCAAGLIRELRKANHSIIFAAYSFTSAEIANELVLMAAASVNVSGIIEKSTTGSKYSKHNALAANSINVKLDSSKKLMHHKFFVIDDSVVVTGSFNPTENANIRNAENLIIIRNPELAGKYTNEFNGIFNTKNS